MSSIDDRIVNMEFNNGKFMSGVKDTIGALDGLKKSLQLKDASKGMDDIESRAKRFSLQGMAEGIESISSKFSAMGVVAFSVLNNVVNKAVDAGARILKSLSLDPVMDGFREYELNMNSIQTILANTNKYGTTLEQVNNSLDELNHYADKTIYNFADMTRNIGLFTNAGLELEESTSMIKGFSNAAAASGTNAQGAASAAYQLSQALSAGTIRLMDWRSLQNVGMGNKNMQEGLVQIAEAMGTISEMGTNPEEVMSDFNGSLEKGWLSADVMSKYLQIMAGDMTEAEMAQLGLTDAQINGANGFLAQQKIAEDAATKVRTFTQLMDTMKEAVGSSWSESFKLFVGDFDQATKLFTAANDAIGPVIDSMGDARNSLISGWIEAGGRDSAIRIVVNLFNAIQKMVKPIKEAFREIFPPITGKQIAAITEALANFTEKLKMGDRTTANVKRTFRGLFAVLDIVWTIFKEIGKVIGRVFGEFFDGAGGVAEFSGSLGDALVNFRDFIKSGDALSRTFEVIGDVLVGIVTGIKEAVKFLGKLGGIIKTFALDGFAAGWEALKAGFDRFVDSFSPIQAMVEGTKKAFSGFMKIMKSVKRFLQPLLDWIGEAFSNALDVIKKMFSGADIGDAIGLLGVGSLAGIGVVLKKALDKITGFFDKEGAGGIIDSIKGIFGSLTDTMEAMQNNLKAGTLLKIAGAIALLTASVIALSLVDPVRLASSLTAMTVMFGQLIGSLALFDKLAQGGIILKLPVLATGLILLGVAIGLLTISLVALSQLDWESLGKGAAGIGSLLAMLGLFTQWMGASKIRGIVKASGAMILLGIALNILIIPMKILGDMKWEELGKGAAAIGGLLLMLGLFSQFSGGGFNTIGAGLGLILVATALNIMIKPLQEMGAMSWGEIARSMVTLLGALTLLSLALIVMGSPTTLLGAAGLVVGAAALQVLIGPLERMGKLSWGEIGKGMTVLAGTLILMAVGLTAMIAALPGAIALTVAAAAFQIFIPIFKQMGQMKWGEIGKGIVALGGSLIIMALGLTLMIAALPGAIALTVASIGLNALTDTLITLGGLKWSQIWTGLGALGLALGLVAVAGVLLLPAIPGLLGFAAAVTLLGIGIALAGVGMLAFTTSLTALIAVGSAGVGIVVAFITAIANTIPMIATKIGEGLINIANLLIENAPVMKNLFKTLISTAVEAITETIPEIVEAILTMIDALLSSLEEHVPSFVEKGFGIILGILQGIRDNISEVTTVSLEIIAEFIRGIGEGLPDIIDAGFELIIDFINGISDAIDENAEEMGAAGGRLAVSIINGMVEGITAGISEVVDAAKNLADSAVATVKDWLGINSPSKVFKEIGNWTGEGFVEGMDGSNRVVSDSAKRMGSTALDAVKSSLSDVEHMMTMESGLNPTITPVLDLSQVQKDASSINGMMGHQNLILDTRYNQGLASDNIQLQDEIDLSRYEATITDAKPQATKIEYNQTINSPKAVSPSEVYRDTKSLIAVSQRSLDV